MSQTSQGVQKDTSKPKKEPAFHIYRLVDEHRNKKRRRGADPEYPPTFSIPNTSIIRWQNEGGSWTTRKLRYIKGEETIFQNEQKFTDDDEKNLKLRNPHKPVFGFGELRVPSYDTQLIKFLDLCSMNADSPNRIDSAPIIFKKIDEAKEKQQAIDLMKLRFQALQVASTCKEEDMIPHASFLNIPTYDNAAGQDRDAELIRLDYQELANSNPKLFMDSVNNPKMRTTAMIKKAISSGDISFDKGGVARWASSKAVITTVPSDRDKVEFLTDFSYTEDGASFVVALKALNG